MHQLRRDCRPGDPGESSLDKITLAGCVLSIQGMRMMKVSCEQWHHIQEMLTNLLPQLFQRKGETLPRGKQRGRSLYGV
jgi:hypothetical protein